MATEARPPKGGAPNESVPVRKPDPDAYSLMKRLQEATANNDDELSDVILLAMLGLATTRLFVVSMIEHESDPFAWLGKDVANGAASTLKALHRLPDTYK